MVPRTGTDLHYLAPRARNCFGILFSVQVAPLEPSLSLFEFVQKNWKSILKCTTCPYLFMAAVRSMMKVISGSIFLLFCFQQFKSRLCLRKPSEEPIQSLVQLLQRVESIQQSLSTRLHTTEIKQKASSNKAREFAKQ